MVKFIKVTKSKAGFVARIFIGVENRTATYMSAGGRTEDEARENLQRGLVEAEKGGTFISKNED